MTHFITASFGRNIGTVPMDGALWAEFQTRVAEALTKSLGMYDKIVLGPEFHTGISHWEGQIEESAKVSIVFEGDMIEAVSTVRGHLDELAVKFDQDAIALAYGVSELRGE